MSQFGLDELDSEMISVTAGAELNLNYWYPEPRFADSISPGKSRLQPQSETPGRERIRPANAEVGERR
jgi:hypothetical protein